MHRFYLPPKECRSETLRLTGREAHHALHVLRVQPGMPVVVLDGAGTVMDCTVRACGRREVELAVQQKMQPPSPGCRVTLLQAVPKGKTMESIIQKATELGVTRIVPVLSERVVAHLDGESAAHKTEKWRLVAIEAIKQCGSPWLPDIELPVTPGDFLVRKEDFELSLIASLEPGSRHLREHFDAFAGKHGRTPGSACVWVGPEGDFTSAEVAAVEAAGALPITLGPLVLRSETASVYCLAILNHELHAPSQH